MSLFAKNLRFLRKSGKHNQEEISNLFNKRPNTVGNWENEKSEPSLTELTKLADFFKVTADDLLHQDLEASVRLNNSQDIIISRRDKVHKAHSGDSALEINALNGILNNKAGANELKINTETDGFWMLLREIRTLNDKVDLLLAGPDSPVNKRWADKSSY